MMGQRITKRMPSPDGVAAGQTATSKLPIGSKYHHVMLKYSGVTLAQMTEIRVLANSKVIHRYSATERDTMNQYYRLAAANGILVIPFDRLGLITRAGEEETAINTGSVNEQTGQTITSLNIEIDIDAAAISPALDVYAEISDATPGGPGTILHVKKHSRSAAGAGEFEVSDLPFNEKTAMALNAAFVKPSANDISKITVERGLYKVFERDKAMNELMQANGERAPQTGWHVVDWTERGYGGNVLDLVGYQDFRYRFEMTGAATLTILSEYLGVLGD